jgi:hypothetical protein
MLEFLDGPYAPPHRRQSSGTRHRPAPPFTTPEQCGHISRILIMLPGPRCDPNSRTFAAGPWAFCQRRSNSGAGDTYRDRLVVHGKEKVYGSIP